VVFDLSPPISLLEVAEEKALKRYVVDPQFPDSSLEIQLFVNPSNLDSLPSTPQLQPFKLQYIIQPLILNYKSWFQL
jgi:hypothetical protein